MTRDFVPRQMGLLPHLPGVSSAARRFARAMAEGIMAYEPGDDEDDDARCPYCGARGSEPCHLKCGDVDADGDGND
jgi:hypothetical protein